MSKGPARSRIVSDRGHVWTDDGPPTKSAIYPGRRQRIRCVNCGTICEFPKAHAFPDFNDYKTTYVPVQAWAGGLNMRFHNCDVLMIARIMNE
jgi:hypothetical protein